MGESIQISIALIAVMLTGLGMFVGLVVWFVRLEGKTNSVLTEQTRHNAEDALLHEKMEKRIEKLEQNHDELENRLYDKLSNIERIMTERLARIEGKISMEK